MLPPVTISGRLLPTAATCLAAAAATLGAQLPAGDAASAAAGTGRLAEVAVQASVATGAAPAAAPRRNVLMITADDMSAGDLRFAYRHAALPVYVFRPASRHCS